MARQPRLVIPAQPHHIVQSAVDRQLAFRDDDDHRAFLNWLRDAAKLYKVAIHAYVLLPNQLQILATPSDAEGMARMMQWVGRHYVPYFNKKYHRAGTLWQGRFKASVVDPATHLLLCTRYIEFAPVRAALTSTALDYPWSSHAHHVGVTPDGLIMDHVAYWSLGNTPFEREAAYRALAEQALTTPELLNLEGSVSKGWAIGPDTFKSELERQTNRQVRPGKRGRPGKAAAKPPAQDRIEDS
jgi:putative transposase